MEERATRRIRVFPGMCLEFRTSEVLLTFRRTGERIILWKSKKKLRRGTRGGICFEKTAK